MSAFGDYHIHTRASDGRGTVSAKVARAKELGLSEIAVADHGCGSTVFHQTPAKFARQGEEIARENAKGGIRVYRSVEANIVSPEGYIDLPDEMIRACDALHIGFHRLLQRKYVAAASRFVLVNGWGSAKARSAESMVEMNTRAFVAAIERYPVDVVCHLGHRAQTDINAVCAAAKAKGVYIELNEKHIDALESCADELVASGVEFILGSDAHSTGDVGGFARVLDFVRRHGIDESRVCGLGAKPRFCDKTGFNTAK